MKASVISVLLFVLCYAFLHFPEAKQHAPC